MAAFIRHVRVCSAVFATGYAFWYHEHYKELTAAPVQWHHNQNDFGGHSPAELYVPW